MWKGIIGAFMLLGMAAFLDGCGSGGNDGGTVTTLQKGVAAMKLAGSLPSGQTLNGMDITLDLPPRVSPQTDPTTGKTAVRLEGVPQNATQLVDALYTQPATSPGRSTLRVIVIAAEGFGSNQSVTIPFDIQPGFDPAVEVFKIASYAFTDENGVAITNLVPQLVPTYIY
jgi:hypothetical protein